MAPAQTHAFLPAHMVVHSVIVFVLLFSISKCSTISSSSAIFKSIKHILFGSCDSSFFSFNFQQFAMLVHSFFSDVCNVSTNAADITTAVDERLRTREALNFCSRGAGTGGVFPDSH